MVNGGRCKDLPQNLFLQLPVDGRDTPTAVVFHSGSFGAACGVALEALIPSVILRREDAITSPRIRRR